jgi:hypothetical protein
MALSLLGSANLIRPGLRPNGSSHTASRHRPEATAAKGPCTLARRRQLPDPSLWKGERSSSEGAFVSALGEQRALKTSLEQGRRKRGD